MMLQRNFLHRSTRSCLVVLNALGVAAEKAAPFLLSYTSLYFYIVGSRGC